MSIWVMCTDYVCSNTLYCYAYWLQESVYEVHSLWCESVQSIKLPVNDAL